MEAPQAEGGTEVASKGGRINEVRPAAGCFYKLEVPFVETPDRQQECPRALRVRRSPALLGLISDNICVLPSPSK